jgi:hypothetical protein
VHAAGWQSHAAAPALARHWSAVACGSRPQRHAAAAALGSTRALHATGGSGAQAAPFRPAAKRFAKPTAPFKNRSWKDEEAREVWSVRIQDTPGYGDDTNIQTHIDMVGARARVCL